MAFIPQYDSNFPFCDDSSSQFQTLIPGYDNFNCQLPNNTTMLSTGAMWTDLCYPNLSDNYGSLGIDNYSRLMEPDFTSPPVLQASYSYPERLEVNNLGLSGHDDTLGSCSNVSCIQNYEYFGEECCGFSSPEVKPLIFPTARQDSENHEGQQVPVYEDMNAKVGRYSAEERKERIVKYLKKRNQRNFNKTIKYACRKTLADRRVRIRGRFARNDELSQVEMASKNNDQIHLKEEDLFSGTDEDTIQIKCDEEGWLQEAMSNLMYYPYNSYIVD